MLHDMGGVEEVRAAWRVADGGVSATLVMHAVLEGAEEKCQYRQAAI